MPKIKRKENESIDSVIRRFKTQVNRSKNLITYKENEFFESRSVKDRKIKKEKIRENKKRILKNKNKKPHYL